ncbi:MAG: amidase [Thermomicrobiales bacterium]|nr:amidase [Thermomicrobiales bacterium]
MDDAIFASAGALAHAIRNREVSAVEVVETHLRRIAAVNPALNAVVQLRAAGALTDARRADAALAGGADPGPLHGVPITIKDSIDTADCITTGGTTGWAAFTPPRDATVVARLRAAGAILLGKTNTPELTLAFETDNAVYGQTRNPYDLARSPGGSSGGAAAIVAAGGSPLDIGSDTGGSIRLPAAWCGIAGLRPTSGRVPRTGHRLPPGGWDDALTVFGPMARAVDDLALVLPIIAGPDGRDPAIVPLPLGDPATVEPRSLRVALYTDNGIAPPTPETDAAVRAAAAALADAGAAVEEARPAVIAQTYDLINEVWGADGAAGTRALLREAGTTAPHWLTERAIAIMRPSAAADAPAFADIIARWSAFRAAMLGFMERYDAIVCPAHPTPALPLGAAPDADPAFSYTMTYNLTGWPVVVVRAGTSPQGLPIGAQIVARPWREDVALTAARTIETALGGWRRPPL